MADVISTRHTSNHDDVIKWKHFPRYWSFVRWIHRLQANSTHKGQWRRALMFFFDLRLNKRLSNHRHASDLRRHHAHYNVTTMVRHFIIIMSGYWNGILFYDVHWVIIYCSVMLIVYRRLGMNSNHHYAILQWIFELQNVYIFVITEYMVYYDKIVTQLPVKSFLIWFLDSPV